MNKTIVAAIGIIALAGCASGPTQAERDFAAYNNVINEQVAKKQMTPAEAELARQQYAGALRTRESNIAAAEGIAAGNQAYANNSTMALSAALLCAGQGGRGC
jgi:hypothetical protein